MSRSLAADDVLERTQTPCERRHDLSGTRLEPIKIIGVDFGDLPHVR
jgi:hypothetical protein